MRTSRGDIFVVISRETSWLVVQRDPTGFGLIDADYAQLGWVPTSCLLETDVPIAAAISDALSLHICSWETWPIYRRPILPGSVVSPNWSGVALIDYKPIGDTEVSLDKLDAIRVYRRYSNWSYVRSTSSLPELIAYIL